MTWRRTFAAWRQADFVLPLECQDLQPQPCCPSTFQFLDRYPNPSLLCPTSSPCGLTPASGCQLLLFQTDLWQAPTLPFPQVCLGSHFPSSPNPLQPYAPSLLCAFYPSQFPRLYPLALFSHLVYWFGYPYPSQFPGNMDWNTSFSWWTFPFLPCILLCGPFFSLNCHASTLEHKHLYLGLDVWMNFLPTPNVTPAYPNFITSVIPACTPATPSLVPDVCPDIVLDSQPLNWKEEWTGLPWVPSLPRTVS